MSRKFPLSHVGQSTLHAMLYADKPYLQIDYNRALSCTIHTWKGYFSETEYRVAMNQCLEIMSQTGAKNLIINVQAAVHEYWLDSNWTASEWFPELTQTELQKLAIVIKENYFSESNFYFYPLTHDRFVVSRYFDRLEEAQEWIARKGI